MQPDTKKKIKIIFDDLPLWFKNETRYLTYHEKKLFLENVIIKIVIMKGSLKLQNLEYY